jgi:gliding motility-associated-like protein
MKTKLTGTFLISFVLIQLVSVHLRAQVVANFSATPATGCAPLSVSFTDLSTGSPTSWSWNFGNSNTSTSKNPSAVYSIAGTYTITLVSSKAGSSSTKTSTVTVYANPVANFTLSTTTACIGTTITFTNSSTIGSGPIIKWDWDFGDGNVLNNNVTGIATHAYTTSGTFPLSLIVTDSHGCSHSIIKSVTILPSPVAAFTGTPLTACTPPLTVNFTNNSTGGATYSWSFGDGTPNSTSNSPSHNYTAAGTYTVKLVVTSSGGCKDSITKTNYVLIQGITANFSSNITSGCAGSIVAFTDISTPLSTTRIWDFGDGTATSTLANPTHTYPNPGTYAVSLTANSGGCTDSEIKVAYITIHPLPVVAFTADNTQSCKVPFTVNFTDQSTNSAAWVWNFGDGAPTSGSQNPSHTYTAAGTYTVTLTVTSANGCVSSLTKNNYIVISPPKANFTAVPREGCIPLPVAFTSVSTSTADPITSYKWTFGDGNGTTTGSTTTNNTYTSAGYYTVKLVITTASGCKDSLTRINYVKAGVPPKADFKIVDSTLCYGVSAQFNNFSIGADSAFWQWGDGGTLTSKLPVTNPVTYFYGDTGIFMVTLIVYDKGCPDTLKQPDIVRIFPPKPIFSYQLNCINTYSVKFTDASLGADSISWDFGDGTPKVADLPAPTHIYTTRGPKTVTLTAFNFTSGCNYFNTASFTIADPIASFNAAQTGCYPFIENLSHTGQDGALFTWRFGDGSPDYSGSIIFFPDPPPHSYPTTGSYNIRLIVEDLNGCKDTLTKILKVQGPVPNFKADTTVGCAPLPIIFTDKSVDDSTLVSWTWNFGDGSAPQTVSTPTVNHTFNQVGAYSITMSVTDKNGCTKTITKTNYILPTFPIPKFVSDSFACKGEVITFNAAGTSVVTPATYTWRFGDGTTGAGTPVTHPFTGENNYTVTLIVTDKNGCKDSVKHTVLVKHPTPIFDSTMVSESCGNAQLIFHDQSTGPGSPFTYAWKFGDGGTATSPNPFKTYTVPGTYTVTLTVTNSAGCTASITKNNFVVVPGPLGTFSFNPHVGCRPLTVTFTALSNNTDVYEWDFGDGNILISTNNTVTHTYTKDGIATPILLLGDTLSDGTYCKLPAPTAGTVIVTTVVLVDIDSTIIHLDEDETATLTSNISGFFGTPTYSWTPPTGLSCTNCQNPVVTGDGSGKTITYYLTVTDAGGCVGNDSVKIIFPICLNDDFLIPNVFTPNNDLINDLYDVRGLCKRNKYLIRIYDRWGIQMFSTEDRKISWNGRVNNTGRDVPDGVYYYIINFDDRPTYTGFIQVIR